MCGNKYKFWRNKLSPPPPRLPGEDMWECELHPSVIDTHDDRFSQIGAVIWADLFSVIIEVELLDTTYNSLSQKVHNLVLTLVFVRLFPTSCFVNDFAVESLPRLFSTFEAPCFEYPVEKYVIIIETPVKRLPLRTKTTNKPL